METLSVNKKDVADVHYHSGLTWWVLLMISDKNIFLIDIHILTEDMETS